MTEPGGAGPADRRAPRRARALLGDLTLIVRPAGRPEDIRVFTADEADDAEAYAAAHSAAVESL